MTDKAQAERIAAEIVQKAFVPQTYEQAVALVAYAYARGSRDGFEQGSATVLTTLDELQEAVR